MSAQGLAAQPQALPLSGAAARHRTRQPAGSASLLPCHTRQISSSRQRQQVVPQAVAIGAPAAVQQQHKRQLPARRRQLHDPATLSHTFQASVPVQDQGGAVSLDAYMRLPPDQYDELDPGMIQALGGSQFLLKVPRLAIFNVWVEPEVTISVRLELGSRPAVVFESTECQLKGSSLLNQLGLDKRFVLYFHNELTWQPGSGGGSSSSSSSGSGAQNVRALADGGNGSSSGSSSGAGVGSISAQTEVQVWTEVVGVFKAIPRGVLQGTGNAVLRTLVNALLPVFLSKLADDYRRWANDPEYRARRAAAAAADAKALVPTEAQS